jgi:hypothetical protein
MCKFITIRCKICGSVIYNLPEEEFKSLKLVDLLCEDCSEEIYENSFAEHIKLIIC